MSYRGRKWLAGVVALAPLVLGWGDEPIARPAHPDEPSRPDVCGTASPGRHEVTLQAVGFWWRYHAHVPESHPDPGLPVVVVLHGSGGSGSACLDDLGWAELAEREGFLAVAPDALPAEPEKRADFLRNPRVWNSGQHPPERPRSQIDDVAFFDELLTDLAKRWPIDRGRIYVAGHSNGGAMAFRLAAERAERFAAIAAVSGLCWVTDPQPARRVPTLLLVGLKDPLMPACGGHVILPWEVREALPLNAVVRLWANALGLPTEPTRLEASDGVIIQDYAEPAAPEASPFRVVLVEGHGHHWPGAPVNPLHSVLLGPCHPTLNATDLVWDYLREQVCEPGLADGPR